MFVHNKRDFVFFLVANINNNRVTACVFKIIFKTSAASNIWPMLSNTHVWMKSHNDINWLVLGKTYKWYEIKYNERNQKNSVTLCSYKYVPYMLQKNRKRKV